MNNCPTQNNLEIFLSGAMPANKGETLELHLADCADCRRNLALMFGEKASNAENFAAPAALPEKVKNLPSQESQAQINKSSFNPFAWLKINRLQVAFATILIGCFGLVGFYFLQSRQTSNSDDVLRKDDSNKNLLKLLAPEESANPADEKIEFRWSSLPNAKNYTLVLSDEKGDIIKEISSTQTTIETSISELGLTKDKRYFWHIKAKLTDGSVIESESRKIFK